MAGEVHWRGLVTGVANYYTLRAARGTDINKYWDTTGTPALSTLVTANWANYKIALAETPAGSYLYVGTWPATLTTVGWYYADIYRQSGATASVSDVLVGSFLGYWDGTSYKIAGSDVQEVRGTAQTGGDIVTLIGAIGSGTGAAMNFAASSDNTGGAVHGATFVGAQANGTTYANTAAEDLIYHQLTNTANVIDIVYNFNVGSGRWATKATFKGYIVSSNDTFDVQAWDYANSVWETRGFIVGQSTTTNITKDVTLLGRNTGTGADAGDVHIRLKGRAGNTSPSIFADELLVTASNIGQTVGYSNGSIWVKSDGTSGTTPYVNGTGDNPCPWADALSISSVLGIKRFEVAPATTITLSASAANSSLSGKGWKLALGGQDLSYATITGCELVTGVATSPSWEMFLWSCQMGACTLGEADLHSCHITDVITLGAAAPYLFHNCVGVPIGTPTIDFGSAVGASSVVCGNWTGPCTISNMKAGDVLIFDGTSSLTIAASCTGGTVYINGNVTLTNSGSGQTIHDDSRFAESRVVDSTWDEVLTGATHNVASSAGRRLRQIAASIIIDGTVSSSTANTVTLDAGASSTDGAYDPGLIYIVSGVGAGQCRLILEYKGSTKTGVVDRDWKVQPNGTSDYVIVADAGREHVNEGLAQAGGASTITLNAAASSEDDAYLGQRVFIRSGTGQDQARRVSDYNGTTKVATLTRPWGVVPDTTSAYVMLPTGAITDTDLENAVWNALLASHTSSGSMGEAMDISALTPQEIRDALKLAPSSGAAASGSIDDLLADLYNIPAVTVASILAGTTLTIERNASISFSVTGMGSLVDRTKLAFTMKAASNLDDSKAYIKIEKVEAGSVNHITRINKAAPTAGTDTDGTITIDDAVAGDVTITIAPRSAALIPLTSGIWDIVRWDAAGDKHIEAYGAATVQSTATAATT